MAVTTTTRPVAKNGGARNAHRSTASEPGASVDLAEVIDYTGKTYRYLRVAIVAMVLALIIAMLIERLDAGSWLPSISAYFFTAANPIFVAALVMIGVCLIAIRGTNDFEDIVLNLTGILAPVVALVPTAFPDFPYDGYLFEPDVERLIDNSVVALLLAAVLALVLTFWLASRYSGQDFSRSAIAGNTWIGLFVAVWLVAVLVGLYLSEGRQFTHNAAALGLFAGLWIVAIENVVRHVTDDDGCRSPEAALYAGIGGSLPILAIAVAVIGIWHLLIDDASAALWLFVSAGVLLAAVLVSPRLTTGAARFLTVVRDGDWYRRYYVMIASWMLVIGVVVFFAPIDWIHRTLILELLELIPFGVFWLVQTIEKWNRPVEHFDYRLRTAIT